MTGAFDWQGRVGDVWAAESRRTDRSFSELTSHLHGAVMNAAPQIGTAVDIGCGAGETSICLARAKPDLAVVGIDLSEGLLDVARSKAGSLKNVSFVQGDAVSAIKDYAPVDLYVSRHGVMFFGDPIAAFTAFKTAASPDCGMVFSCFRDWTLNGFAYEMRRLSKDVAPKEGAPGPFAFADQDLVAGILRNSGWKNYHAEAVDISYVAGEGDDPVEDAVSFMRRIGPASRVIADAEEDRRPALIDELRNICEQHLNGNRVIFPAAAWIWSARA
jgi:SAM-dependent methyltransferase